MRLKPLRHALIWEGETYRNTGGGKFKCLLGLNRDTYVLQNINSGWTFTAHVITKYEDGSIEWDYSTGGEFQEVKE